ncbi:S46 family peptidase [Mesorhizobium helmanticense]|uniref:S46 family peptidase n=1 Tax=Mesorhizobium helmanticense TaxID=1776423 RepID=UPI001FDF3EC1|nr:S46 family peptidase [Mesorhizobium helmanticense]
MRSAICPRRSRSRANLSLAPDDVEIITRAAVVALDADDDALAHELLAKLPRNSDATVLKFRFHASRADWSEIARLVEEDASLIPPVEAPIISTTGKLAAIKIGGSDEEARRREISAVAVEAASNPRASVVVADFARREGFEEIADGAFKAALGHIAIGSHAADRLMVAHHAAGRGDSSIVADLLDGHVAEDHDNNELRVLARAFVNDSPIRQRALSFFERLPAEVRGLPFFLHAEGLLHFNRGALPEAEAALRKAIATQPELDTYLALFSVLHRLDRGAEVKAVIEGIDLDEVMGTPGQKMSLAQVMRKVGEGAKALEYAYAVLQSARNDHEAALRYFGPIMMDPEDGFVPSAETVAVDTWVRLESDRREVHAFLIEEGEDRPAEDVLSPTHATAAAALGLSVGDVFEMPAVFGEVRKWRVAEIKHKYLHALHDMMENFEKRFPDAEGFYKITMEEGDIQPALDQVRRVSESNRKLADPYLRNNCPLSLVVSKRGGDTIRFVEYVRSLDFDIRTCVGTDAERVAARQIIERHGSSGAVLDTYTAWTVSTMDAFDVLKSIFGSVIVAQSVVDELRTLRDEQDLTAERSMTVAWHNGEYIKQEHTAEDAAARRAYIQEQLSRIETACEVRPVIVADNPSELATMIHQSFGSDVLDAANLAGTEHVLVSEDMHYRPKSWLPIAREGVQEGDFVMVAGFPGATQRFLTADEVRFNFAEYEPLSQRLLSDYAAQIKQATAGNREAQIRYASTLRGVENYKKKLAGDLAGADAIGLDARKATEEEAFRAWVAEYPVRQTRFDAAIRELDAMVGEISRASLARLRQGLLNRAHLLSSARTLYRWTKEHEKPDEDRESGFQDRDRKEISDQLTQIERRYLPDIDRKLFEAALDEYRRLDEKDRDTAFESALGQTGLDRLYAGTKLADTATRLGWLDKPAAAFEASDDPFIKLAVALYPGDIAAEQAAKDRAGRSQAARAIYMHGQRAYRQAIGRPMYPDANGSLRITWGKVAGRTRDGQIWTPFTTAEGLLAKETGKGEFDAPDAAIAAIRAKDYGPYVAPALGTLPVNFLSTADITNGNSGSATLNGRGEFVGLAFDGTLDAVISDWAYAADRNRSIHVDSRFMLWTMDKIDGAGRLLKEMGVLPASRSSAG